MSFTLLLSALSSTSTFAVGAGVLATAVTALVLVRLNRLNAENRRQGRYFQALVENVSDNILVLDGTGTAPT